MIFRVSKKQLKQVIKKNNKKIDKKIDKLKRNELITKLIHLDLINKLIT